MVEDSSQDQDGTREGGTPQPVPVPVPSTVRGAGAVGALQGGLGVIAAIVLVVLGATGHNGSAAGAFGTAAWFAILAGALLAAGIGLLRGRRWGRAIVFIAEILLLPISWYVFTSHQPQYAVPVGLSALLGLGFLLAPASSRWMAAGYDTAES